MRSEFLPADVFQEMSRGMAEHAGIERTPQQWHVTVSTLMEMHVLERPKDGELPPLDLWNIVATRANDANDAFPDRSPTGLSELQLLRQLEAVNGLNVLRGLELSSTQAVSIRMEIHQRLDEALGYRGTR